MFETANTAQVVHARCGEVYGGWKWLDGGYNCVYFAWMKGGNQMIPIKYKAVDLIGRKCRPVCNMKNHGGAGITPATICTIVDVVRGHGFIIKTDACPHCGQRAYITHVPRIELELIEEDAE